LCNNPAEPLRKTSSGHYAPAFFYEVHDRSVCFPLMQGKLLRRIGQYAVVRAVTVY
jgi:hypothetical protein